jgi:hypothetical protein
MYYVSTIHFSTTSTSKLCAFGITRDRSINEKMYTCHQEGWGVQEQLFRLTASQGRPVDSQSEFTAKGDIS